MHEALSELGFADLTLVGVAKGPDRKPGQERLFVYGAGAPRIPEAHSPAVVQATPGGFLPQLPLGGLVQTLPVVQSADDAHVARQAPLVPHRNGVQG